MNTAQDSSRRMAPLIGLLMLGFSVLGLQKGLAQSAASSTGLPSAKMQLDWSGTWLLTQDQGKHNPYATCCTGPGHWIPLTPRYRKMRDDFAKLPEYTVAKNKDNLADCISPGVPGQLEHPSRFEFLLTPGRVTMIHEEGTVRRIWTDGRSFPNDLKPSAQGYSIGYWKNDGKTLVVNTEAISPTSDLFMVGPLKVTAATKVTERLSVQGPKRLRLQVTVEDPEIFTRSYTYTRNFMKIPGDFEIGCAAYNRDNGHDGSVDLTPPPEALSPTQ